MHAPPSWHCAPRTRIPFSRPGAIAFRPAQVEIPDHPAFVRMVRSMFTQRRKTLHNALKPFAADAHLPADEALDAAGIDGRRRPETLNMKELSDLIRAFQTPGS